MARMDQVHPKHGHQGDVVSFPYVQSCYKLKTSPLKPKDRNENHLIEMVTRGVACLKINVRNCGDFINKSKKGAFTNCADPGSAFFAMLSIFLVTVDNIKSDINQDLF